MHAKIHMTNGETLAFKETSSLNGQFYSEISDISSFQDFVSSMLNNDIAVISNAQTIQSDKELGTYHYIRTNSISHIAVKLD